MTTPNIQRVRIIIDIDGFRLSRSKYLVKECAYIDLRTKTAHLYRFKVEQELFVLPPDIQRSIKWVTNHIHGLAFNDAPNDLPQKKFHLLLFHLIRLCKKDNSYIAYKGGDVEKNFLTHAGAPNLVNLEVYDVPKFNEIYNLPPYKNIIPTMFKRRINKFCYVICKFHKYSVIPASKRKNSSLHCPLEEVLYFAAYIVNRFPLLDSSSSSGGVNKLTL